jgi:hypothetical protein
VTNASPSAAASARTVYSVTFKTSSTGALSGSSNAVTLTFPAGTAFSIFAGVFSLTDVTTSAVVGGCGSQSGTVVTCDVSSGDAIHANDTVIATLGGVSNPATVGSYTLSVSTSSDPTAVTSPAYRVVANHSLTAVKAIITPTAATSARAVYLVSYKTSSTGALSNAAGSQIALTIPTGTHFPSNSVTTVTDTTSYSQVGSCTRQVPRTVLTSTLSSGAVISAGDGVTIELDGLTNPTSAGPQTLSVSTTSDAGTITTNSVAIVAGQQISALAVTLSDNRAGTKNVTYTISFQVSATGAMSTPATSEVSFSLAGGLGALAKPPSIRSNFIIGTLTDDTIGGQVGECNTYDLCPLMTSSFGGPTFFISAKDTVSITLPNRTNPAAGTFTATVSTTSDTAGPVSTSYTIV